MHNVVPIETNTELQLTDNDKLRNGIVWDALSPNSRRAYQLAWRQFDEFLSSKGEAWIISQMHNWQPTSQLSGGQMVFQ